MKDKILETVIITIEYLIIVMVALLAFVYVVVPLAHNLIQEKTIYVDRPCPIDSYQSEPNEIIDEEEVRLL